MMISFFFTSEYELSDSDFMVTLYSDFEKLLFATAYKYTSDREVAEDIVQETLLNLCEKINTIKSMKRIVLAAYIRTSVRNVAINMLKYQSHDADHRTNDYYCDPEKLQSSSLEDAMLLVRYKDLLRKIWPGLSKEEQVLLEGKYILGYSDHELSEITGCKASSVRMKLTRARRHAFAIIVEQEGVTQFDEA